MGIKMNTTSLYCMFGMGFAYTWMWGLFYTSLAIPFEAIGDNGFLLIVLFWILGELCVFLRCYFLANAWKGQKPMRAGIEGALATALICLSYRQELVDPLMLCCVSTLLFGHAWANINLLCGSVYSQLGYQAIRKTTSMALGLGAVIFVLFCLADVENLAFALVALPLASSLLLKACPREQVGQQLKADSAPQRNGTVKIFSPSLAFMVVIVAASVEYLYGMGISVYSGDYHSMLLFFGFILAALVLQFAPSLHCVFQGAVLASAAGLLLVPFAPQTLGAAAIGIAWVAFDTLVWALCVAQAKKHRIDPASVLSTMWIIILAGMYVGIALGWVVGEFAVAWAEIAVPLALSYLTLVGLSASSEKPLWFVIEDETKRQVDLSRYESGIEDVAKKHLLTPREAEVFELLAYGRDIVFITDKLCISRNTAKTHIRHIYSKVGVSSRQQLLDKINEACKAIAT